MGSCHLKHSELAEHLQTYKGRVVLRGDTAQDDTGCQAVFAAGASASQVTATIVLGTLFPTRNGAAIDAVSASQVKIEGVFLVGSLCGHLLAELWWERKLDELLN